MIVKPIAQLPSVYLEEIKTLAICNAAAPMFAWVLATWDPVVRSWFVGDEHEFMMWAAEAEPGDEAGYISEPTHFFELPALPKRIGTH